MPSMTQEHPHPEKVEAKKSPKIQLHQQTVQQLFSAKPSTTMCNTTATPMHMEQPPSKEQLVPMEVVVEASLVSTQDMEVNEDLKKWERTNPIMMSTADIGKKESPEQKRT